MLLDRSPEYWARDASIPELQQVVQDIETWSEPEAEVLDFAYMERCARTLSRPQATSSRDDALTLADHLERVAHDSERAALDRLERPYFARWRLLAELMHRCALRQDVPRSVLDRKHVRELLLRIETAGGRIAQSDLGAIIRNEGQRSVTLKLMEQWDLIERQHEGTGNTRLVTITALGRLAIADQIGSHEAAAAAPTHLRFVAGMTSLA
jgi:hypothetical protein